MAKHTEESVKQDLSNTIAVLETFRRIMPSTAVDDAVHTAELILTNKPLLELFLNSLNR
jgi:hypothetical protein